MDYIGGMLDYSKLLNNIIEMLREQQIKLGFMKETVRLYYPLKSLNRFLLTDVDTLKMEALLNEFACEIRNEIGTINISCQQDRFCFACGPDVAEYVHDHMEGAQFLEKLIALVSKHGTSINDVCDLFKEYSNSVVIQDNISDEFDMLIYFADGEPDDFRYCISFEGEHVIYHRFTEADYLDIYGV